MRRALLGAAVVVAAALVGAGMWVRVWWQTPLAIGDEAVTVHIAPGETLGGLSSRLAARGYLEHPLLLNVVARLTGADQRVRSGEYAVPVGSTPGDLLALLQSDRTVRYQVTLPEGITIARALQLLQEAPALRATLQGPEDPRLLALVAPAAATEGFFLPETYQYQRGDSDLDVLTRAHTLMRGLLEEQWQRRDPALPLATPYDALILASVIERETGLASERRAIAGVFRRRLERGMRLQTDPTVIYGLGPRFDGNLTRAHLKDERNPYNTYRHRGLPPGPICLPGAAAVRAALDPASGDELYFVARGDGSHVFSATLAAHEQAVRDYQLQRRADYRSAPRGEER